MAVNQVLHPSSAVLQAFALGKLNDSTASVVMNHLDGCPDCCERVAALSGDDFLDRLRQAHGRSSTPAPAETQPQSAVGPKPSASPQPIRDLPPELANSQQYEIVRELGRGGMGVVYLAKNKLMDRLEVLKVVNKTLIDHPAAVERFLREIRSAARLSHANVVTAYSAVQSGELLAFAMEYVEGQDLASLVKSQGPLPVPHACYYVQQAALGLQHAFEKQMVHRDIKPQNLILAREGKKHIVKVLDFGLAKVMREKTEDTGLTGEGKMLGTPDYIAPEQTLDAAKADIRADIYSLGCTLYYLLSGHPPFSGTSLGAVLMAHQMQEAKPLNLDRPEVPEELAAVVRKMMAKTPAKRYQKPVEVVQALALFVKQGATPKSPPELSAGASRAAELRPAKPTSPPPPITLAKQSPPASEPPHPVAWETMTEGSITSTQPRRSGAIHKRRPSSAMTAMRKKWLIGSGLGVGVLLLALLGMWASGVFVKTKYGTIVLENLPPDAEVLVDGQTVTVSWGDGGKKAEIHVKPGSHKVEVKKAGFSVDGKELTFKDGDRVIFTARLLPEKSDNPQKAETPPPDKPSLPPERKKPDVPQVASGIVEDKGFKPLFNDRDLTGWSVDGGPPGQWVVEGNTIVGQSKDFKTRNYLLTEKDYSDFVFRFEFKVEEGSHGGVAIRAREGEKMPLNNILIFDHPIIKLTNPAKKEKEPTGTTHWIKSAAAYVAPVQVLPLPTGVWHSMEVVVRGDNCTATVGGKKLVDVTLDPDARNNGAFVPGLGRGKGKVGFQINTGILRFRKIEIKELPAAKAEAPAAADAAPPPAPPRSAENKSADKGKKQNAEDPPAPRGAESSLPPEAKKAAEAFEKARDDARAKFLDEFDKVLDGLAKIKGSPELRLRMIDAVKEEKKRFEDRGLIPFSEPMRPYLAKYFLTSLAVKEKLVRVYTPLIDAQIRAKNDSMVAELKAELESCLGVRQVVARWRHYVNGELNREVVLYSDGKGGGWPGSRWSFENGVLYYKLPNSTIPGGFGIDKLQVSPDGLAYSGFFDTGKRQKKPIKVTGTYLKPD